MFENLAATIHQEVPRLEALSEPWVSAPRATRSWTRKEELGHLIDSASNNHIRFARGAFESEFHGPTYNPDAWVKVHRYNQRQWPQLVSFWAQYNLFLAELVQSIPEPQSQIQCHVENNPPATLQWVIKDYIVHLQHHVDQILDRPNPTVYPQRP